MVIGVLKISLEIEGNRSLKGKRSVLRHIKESVKNHFGASVAEVADHDLWQSAILGIALVGNDSRVINAALDKIINHVERLNVAVLRDHEMEIIHI